jgi:NTE family protein
MAKGRGGNIRVGLVMGAGGVIGGAWLTGGLSALARETGWDPSSADFIIGTSAGAMMAALLASGVPPWFMVRYSAGESFAGLDRPANAPEREPSRTAGAVFRWHPSVPRLLLGSPRLALRTLRDPRSVRPITWVAGFGPRGFISTEPLKQTVRRLVPTGWADHPNLWITAADYQTGERVVFGRGDSPPPDLADAVAASCAIPGFYHPVLIDGREYIDGGTWSTSNLDLTAGLELDLVICLNPMSSLHRSRSGRLGARLGEALRGPAGRRLGSEARMVRDSGTEVILVQPTGQDLRAMGSNWMSRRRRQEVIQMAQATVREQLRAAPHQELLARLPKGAPHMIDAPDGEPVDWPGPLGDLARARRTA